MHGRLGVQRRLACNEGSCCMMRALVSKPAALAYMHSHPSALTKQAHIHSCTHAHLYEYTCSPLCACRQASTAVYPGMQMRVSGARRPKRGAGSSPWAFLIHRWGGWLVYRWVS